MLTQISPFVVVEDSRKFVLFMVQDREGSLLHCIRSGPGKEQKESHLNIKYAFFQELTGTDLTMTSLGGAFMFIVSDPISDKWLISLTGFSADLGSIKRRRLVIQMFQENYPNHTIIDHLD